MATYYKISWNGSYADKTVSGYKFALSTTTYNFSWESNWGYSGDGTGQYSMYAAPITSDALGCPYFTTGANPGSGSKSLQWLYENGYGNRIVVPIYKSSHVYLAGVTSAGQIVGCGSLTEATQTTYTHKIQSNNTNLGTASASANILYLDGIKYSGSRITAKATAKSGAHFTGWSGDTAYATISGTSCTIPADVASNVTVTANFAANPSLTYDANGGSSTPASQSYYGNVTLAAAPTKAGYIFGGWSIGGSTYQPGDTYNLVEDVTATALWIGHKGITTSVSLPPAAPDQPTPLSVTISPASQDGGWDEGTAITATASASGLGVEFEAWNATGVDVQVVTANSLSFTMPDLPVSLIATYKMKELAVTCTVDSAARAAGAVARSDDAYITDAGGQQSPTGFQYGDTVIFHAPEPESGFTFAGWYDASGVQRSVNINYTLMLTSDITLYARYAVTVTVAKDEEDGFGTFSVNGATYQAVEITLPAELGQPLAIAASSADGSYFGGWKIDGAMSDLFREDSITVTAAHVFTAVFVSEPVSVSVTCLSEKNDPQAEGLIGSLAVLGATGTGGVFSVDGFSEITLVPSPSSESGALPLFRVVEVITEGQTESYREVAAPYVVRVSNADRTFKALWGEKANFLITVSSEDEAKGVAYVGESPSVRSAMYAQDTQVAVTALPTNGNKFVGWYENGQFVSSNGRYVFVVLNEPRTLEARFEDDAFAICEWEGSDEPKTMEWTSKVYVTARPFDPVAARVDATGYPVDLTVRTYSSPDKANALPARDHALTAASPLPIGSQDGRRLPRMRPERYVQITVRSSHEIDAVVVGTNMTEVN